ncbi:hypothetical protein PUNSTDRAFT_55549 [Punctularia strigosozonata HHB-11173 SS5]|uniref:Uncharacterized protein n=1 Tax=Punctularia strigosozonata (strain HHB-11173) TaxID=741275 RepID=R7S2C3_PUNST|nr:uncharacterized protein PUNSTDRAFT_55549 [Punctularia strigosozonata HHB-11173 SS5]EIN04550.1 hypothetical protein PUNSTDRAFT_55549 [Punctularia strigosozonata HHB-11173 SS5]
MGRLGLSDIVPVNAIRRSLRTAHFGHDVLQHVLDARRSASHRFLRLCNNPTDRIRSVPHLYELAQRACTDPGPS